MFSMTDKAQLIVHLLIALALFPLYSILGETFKLAIAPYIFYLVWSRNPAYLPALFIHFTPGTTVSIAILVSTLIVAVYRFKSLLRLKLHWLFLSALLPAPYFIYQTIERSSTMGLGLVDTLIPLGYYLGLFPFFYGVLVSPKLTRPIIEWVLGTLFLLPFLGLVPGIELSIRAYWLSFPLFMSLLFVKLLVRDKMYIPIRWILLSAVFTILSFSGVLGLTFTLLFAGLVAMVAAISAHKRYSWLLSFIVKPRVIILSVAIVVGLIAGSAKYGNVLYRSDYSKGALSYNFQSWDEFWTLLQYKAFDDRAVIWAGGWNIIKNNNLVWPPYEPPKLGYTTATGADIEDRSYGIHNIGLELMRNYGMVMGGLIVLAYLWMLIIGPGKYLLQYNYNSYLLILAGACLGSGIVGGLVGQYVLQVTFSFILMSICGILFGQQRLLNSKTNGESG